MQTYSIRKPFPLLFLLIFCFYGNAITLVDIRETDFGSCHTLQKDVVFVDAEGGGHEVKSPKQVRLAAFDAAKFQYNQVLYLMTPEAGAEYVYKVPHSSGKGTNIEIKYTRNAAGGMVITIIPHKPDDQYWYFVPQAMKDVPAGFECMEFMGDTTRDPCWLLRAEGSNFLPSKDLVASLKSRSTKKSFRKGDDFNITFRSAALLRDYILLGDLRKGEDATEVAKAYQLVGKDPKNQEAGFLGELATDLYFFLHGCTKWDSKIDGGADHGWDHIFVDTPLNPSFVCIVDTKFTTGDWSGPDLDGEIARKFKQGTLHKMAVRGLHPAQVISKLLTDTSIRKKLYFLGVYIRSDGLMKFPYYSHANAEPDSIPGRAHAEKDADSVLKFLGKKAAGKGAGVHLEDAKPANGGAGAVSDDEEVKPAVSHLDAVHDLKSPPAGPSKIRVVIKKTGDPKAASGDRGGGKPAPLEPDEAEAAHPLPIDIGNAVQAITRGKHNPEEFLAALAARYGYKINLEAVA